MPRGQPKAASKKLSHRPPSRTPRTQEAHSTARSTSSKTLRTRTRTLPTSADDDDILSEVEVSTVQQDPPRRRLLQSVVIPNMVKSGNLSARSKKPRSLISSDTPGGSTRATSLDYDTPGTSLATTPAALGSRTAKGKGKAPALEEPTQTLTNGKRKIRVINDSADDDLIDDCADFQLAKALQEEEYAAVSTKRRKTGLAAETDESDLSSPESLLSEDAFAPVAGNSRPPPRFAKPGPVKWEALAPSVSNETSLSRPSTAFTESSYGSADLSLPDQESADDDPDDLPPPAVSSRRRARQRASVWRDRLSSRKDRERFKLEKNHPELKTMWEDLKAVPPITPNQAEQPPSITRTLKSFQLEGLDWMIRQEKTAYKGGLLGDEMGMGKTIQAVALIMSDYPQKKPTLVLVPPVALVQWSNEIAEYTDGKLKVLVYHGTNAKCKKMTVKDLKKFDVIIISYNSLESLHRKETKGWGRGDNIVKEASPIHAIQYHRLILDEAHSIKARQTGSAKACFALRGTFKWCLSGTPVQNRIGEFFSLLRFLEVRPFADYFCKACDCAQIQWTIGPDHFCSVCKHSAAQHISIFNQELLNPITSDSVVERHEALEKLHLVTARIMLRRMKRDYTSSMELPPKEIVLHNEFFGEIERDFSSSIMSNTGRKFDTYVAQGVMLNNYANIFGLIMQMRQVADHPDLLLKKHAHEGQNVLVCNICDEPAEEAIRSRCKHEFCRSCVKSYVEACEGAGGQADCPRCHITLSIDFDQPEIEQDEELVKSNSIINRIKMENWTSSTKIEMLVYDLYKLRSKKQTLKSIVFSQFTSMLQLIEWRLRRAGFNTVMLDGSMTPAMRQKSIEYFMKNADVEVFLVSLKAGGVALNLTEASRVFIVDPWWNPAAEWQSADRCHRIGQRRPCVITRLCIEDSVESRMVLLQEKKARMISGTVNNDKVAMEKLTPEDMQFLFRGT